MTLSAASTGLVRVLRTDPGAVYVVHAGVGRWALVVSVGDEPRPTRLDRVLRDADLDALIRARLVRLHPPQRAPFLGRRVGDRMVLQRVELTEQGTSVRLPPRGWSWVRVVRRG